MIILTTEVGLLEAMTVRDVEYIGRYDAALQRTGGNDRRDAAVSHRDGSLAALVQSADLRSKQ